MSSGRHPSRAFLACLCVAFAALAAPGCRRSTTPPPAQGENSADALELVFTYGSEKEAWIRETTDAWNRLGRKSRSGRPVRVEAIPIGSGEAIEELLAGTRKAHLTSPASAAFIALGNAQSRARTGRDLIGPTENLVLSP